jgi:formylmethanofuran:tetrahydromethanopterin formyltransferase
MIKTGFNSENHLVKKTKHLYDELVVAKTEEALNFVGKGYEDKKKIFMRKIFNDPILNSQLL